MAEGARPLVGEIAGIDRDPLVPQYTNVLQPQDETLARRGGAAGIGLYDEIHRDPHALAVIQKRTLEVVSREWIVQEASDRRADKKAAELVQRHLKAMNLDKLTMGLMGAVLKGFAVAEIIWRLQDGEWMPRAKVRKQRRFRFGMDGAPRLITRAANLEGEALPDRKFVVHRFALDHTDDDPYGLGLGSVLFWPAWFKRQVLAFWLKAAEKFAEPTTLATYSGQYDKDRQNQILQAIQDAKTGKGLVVPSDVIVTLLQVQGNGVGEVHEALARYLDELMSEAVLGETLSTNSGERGARSLGEVHNDVRLAIAKADADLVSATLNDTLVRWIVEVNMPGAKPPTVWRNFDEVEDLNDKVDRDTKIAGMGYKPKSVEYINETYGGDWIEKTPPSPAGADPNAPPAAAGATDAMFAENAAATPPAPTDPLVDALDRLAQPAIDDIVQAIRAEVMAATSREDLAERLLAIVPGLDITRLADVMEAAITAADLTGRSTVLDEAGAATAASA